MTYFLITFRSITFAQQAQHILRSYFLDCTLQRTPKELAERGCGYCLRVRESDAQNAVDRIRQHNISFGKVYAIRDEVDIQERTL